MTKIVRERNSPIRLGPLTVEVLNRPIFCIVAILLSMQRQSFRALASTFESDVTALNLISMGWQAKNLNWMGDDPCGSSWTGVICDERTNTNVVHLSLSSMALSGRLLGSIGNLVNLESLDFSFNPNLTGPIPDTIGHLRKLKSLNLQGCNFSGGIPPSLGNLTQLQFLALNRNQLNGIIPYTLGGLESVYWFDLSENHLSGPLPVSSANSGNLGLDNLTAAVHFHLNNNTLFGSIPREICFLPNLIHLMLDGNNFSGAIPEEISNFPKLQILRLDGNGFLGGVPSSINNISSLFELHLSSNKLTGDLPDLSGLQQLLLLRLSQNMFAPQLFPTWILNLSSLETIEMDNDNLIGAIPPSLFNLRSLEAVSFQNNHINGSLQFNKVTATLVHIHLENNDITDVGSFNGAQFQIALQGNPVCSDTRYDFSSSVCSDSSVISSDNTSLTWVRQSPSCGTTCEDSKILNPNFCTCSFPLVIQFQFNSPSFSDMSPSRISDLENQLANNFNLSSKQVVALDGYFTVNHRLVANVLMFPLGSADSLSSVQVSSIIVRLGSQNVSLERFGPFILISLAEPPRGSKKGSKVGIGAIVGICVGVVGFFLIVLCIAVYALRQKKRAEKAEAMSRPFASWGAGTKDSGSGPNLKGARWFPYTELKKATNNFSDNNLIGVGAYGKVYKGILVTGDIVAIKRAHQGSLQGASEFKNEIELLSRVHHRNLVGLIGFCYEQGEQMLVYEYMSEGTLREHLNKSIGEAFHWKKRLEIALGSAKGLAYLHELANPPIIHRDVKSPNILLDDKLVAKVADFGLSKLVDDGKVHLSTQVKGTLGYLDPEYYMTQQLTEKSDVYSFGVVLLELITARQPIQRGKYIVREVRTALDKGGLQALHALLDPSLSFYPNRDMKKYVDLACSCVEEIGSKRPSMSEVAKELEILLENVSGSDFTNQNTRIRRNDQDIYDTQQNFSEGSDPSFHYSGGFGVSTTVEPK